MGFERHGGARIPPLIIPEIPIIVDEDMERKQRKSSIGQRRRTLTNGSARSVQFDLNDVEEEVEEEVKPLMPAMITTHSVENRTKPGPSVEIDFFSVKTVKK